MTDLDKKEIVAYLQQELKRYAEAQKKYKRLPKDEGELFHYEWEVQPNGSRLPKRVDKYEWLRDCFFPKTAGYITATHNVYNLLRSQPYRHIPSEQKVSDYSSGLNKLLFDLKEKYSYELEEEEKESVKF